MELSLYAATLGIGSLALIATVLLGVRRHGEKTPFALAIMETGMLLFIAQPFAELLAGKETPAAFALGMAGLVAFCLGGPAFSAAFYGKPAPRVGRALRIALLAAALYATAVAVIDGKTPRVASSLALFGSLSWMEIEGLVAVLRMPKGKPRAHRIIVVAGTAAFLPLFVADSAFGGGIYALPAFCVMASVVGLFAIARNFGGDDRIDTITAIDAFATFCDDFDLSPREREVAALLTEGLSNARIAERLFISTKTVETHVTSIYRKANVDGRFEFLAKIRAKR